MKTRTALAFALISLNSACIFGCVADESPDVAADGDDAEDVAAADSAVTGAEVLDQQQTSFNGGAISTGPSGPMAQVFTAGSTGYLSRFAVAAAPCYLAWNRPCGFTLKLHKVDGSGNPGQVLWTGTGQLPPQPEPGWAFAWTTTTLQAPPLVTAGTQYAISITPDWWGQFILGNGHPGYALQWQQGYNYWAHIGNSDDLNFKTWVTPLTAPSTCAEQKAMTPAAGDGEYVLNVGGKSLRIYCADMATTPAEYLTVRSFGGANVSYYGQGQNSSGLTTSFTRVRLYLNTLMIDWNNTRFSSSTGWKIFGPNTYYTNSFGEAADCRGDFSQTGTANIDLRGTPLAVVPGQFVTAGWNPAGSVAQSSFDQVVNLTGGGYCGATTSSGPLIALNWAYSGSLPATCAAVKALNPSAPDGEYTLGLAAGPASIYCRNMAGTPAEYLTLKNTGGSSNFSQYTAGGYMPGTTVKTNYTRVRIDPQTLLVNIADQTFATTTGFIQHGATAVTSMPFGAAMSCNSAPSGLANIDLTGTPFAVAANEFVQGGYAASGSSSYSSGNKVVNVTGGGECGWTVASPDTYNPVNTTGTFQLNLVYSP